MEQSNVPNLTLAQKDSTASLEDNMALWDQGLS